MNENFNLKIYLKEEKDSTSKVHELFSNSSIYLDLDGVLDISGISRKQFGLYLYRHKNIPVTKVKITKAGTDKKIVKKLIHVCILEYLLKNSRRIAENAKNKNTNN